MYDCFNMAYQDNANALQLHIKSKDIKILFPNDNLIDTYCFSKQ